MVATGAPARASSAHCETVCAGGQIRVRNRMQVFANRREPNRAWLLDACSGHGDRVAALPITSNVAANCRADVFGRIQYRAPRGMGAGSRRSQLPRRSRSEESLGGVRTLRWTIETADRTGAGRGSVTDRRSPASRPKGMLPPARAFAMRSPRKTAEPQSGGWR